MNNTMELLEEAGVCPAAQVVPLQREADELVRILQTSLSTARRHADR